MSKIIVVLIAASVLNQSDAFKQSHFNRFSIGSQRKTELADFSAFHDSGVLSHSLDAINHVVEKLSSADIHALHSSFNVADADIPVAPAASIYSKIDKTGFIGTCADYIEQAIDLSHSLFLNLGIKNSYGFSIILFTFLSKCLIITQHSITLCAPNIYCLNNVSLQKSRSFSRKAQKCNII